MGDLRETIGSWAQKAAKNAGWIVGLGVVTVIAGFLAMGSPLASWALASSSSSGSRWRSPASPRTIGAFSAGSLGEGTLAFIGGMLTVGAGLVLTARPGIGLATLTLLLGGYLLVDGISARPPRLPRAAGEGMGLHARERRHRRDPGIPAAPGVAGVRAVGHRHDGGGQPAVQRDLHDLRRLGGAEPGQAVVVDQSIDWIEPLRTPEGNG